MFSYNEHINIMNMESKRIEIYKLLNDYSDRKLSVAEALIKLNSIFDKFKPISFGNISQDVAGICIEAYKNGEKSEAIKTLIEEYRRVDYRFGIAQAKEFLEAHCE